jgi:hypothetical protein
MTIIYLVWFCSKVITEGGGTTASVKATFYKCRKEGLRQVVLLSASTANKTKFSLPANPSVVAAAQQSMKVETRVIYGPLNVSKQTITVLNPSS